jgi:hypothetical protein
MADAKPQSILDKIKQQVAQLSPAEVKEQLAKLQEQKEKQKQYRSGKTKDLTPEQKAKRQAYNKERMKRPEVKKKMKEYRERPEVKEKMKQYRKERYERQKALRARAKELGFIDQKGNLTEKAKVPPTPPKPPQQ